MQTKRPIIKSIYTAVACLLSPALLWAGGFQVNLQGQKQTAMGHCGIALPLDNSAIVFNPGTLIFVDSLGSFSAGAAFVFPRTVYLDPNSTYSAQTVNHTGTPLTVNAHFKFKKSSPISFGFGLYNPFGSRIQWDDDWKGKFLIREISLRTFFYQPTISYKISDRIGIGLGYIFANGGFNLRRALPIQDSLANYGEVNLIGKASGQGFNSGIYFKASDRLKLGLNYRSSVKVKVENGTADFTAADAVSQYFQDSSFNTQLNLPFMWGVGAAYQINEKITATADINYVGWSAYDSLKIDFAKNSDKLKDLASPRLYKNSFIFRTGIQYQLNELITIRAGAYYDQTPVQDGYVTPETPDSDKLGLTTGISVSLKKWLYIDASLLYVEGFKRTDINLETQFEATYKSRGVIPGLNIGLKF